MYWWVAVCALVLFFLVWKRISLSVHRQQDSFHDLRKEFEAFHNSDHFEELQELLAGKNEPPRAKGVLGGRHIQRYTADIQEKVACLIRDHIISKNDGAMKLFSRLAERGKDMQCITTHKVIVPDACKAQSVHQDVEIPDTVYLFAMNMAGDDMGTVICPSEGVEGCPAETPCFLFDGSTFHQGPSSTCRDENRLFMVIADCNLQHSDEKLFQDILTNAEAKQHSIRTPIIPPPPSETTMRKRRSTRTDGAGKKVQATANNKVKKK